jgi:hypothetical protein
MESQNLEPQNMPSESEVLHVPLWVKSMLASGVVLFLIQIPTFTDSLSEAIQQSRASTDYDHGQYLQAIEKYKELHAHHPSNTELTKKLGFSYYHAGLYVETLDTFNQLSGVKMSKKDAEEINAAMADIVKLNHKK